MKKILTRQEDVCVISLEYAECAEEIYANVMKTVSEGENAVWLIDYWCGKDVGGLIKVPLSRHWIMHVEACLRIRNKVRPDLI